MFKMIIPIALVIISNCFYNIVTKKTPESANAFLSLSVTYFAAAVFSFIAFFIGKGNASFPEELKKLNWTSLVLGIVIVVLELGYILAYRAGWDVSKAPLVANTCLAIALIFIGKFVFGEMITAKHIVGMIICFIGLTVVTI